ncbi:MAG TPA: glycosyl hydrolase [Gammaproteobacteria bacterium]|nr:glycosyl hydrolase [Gammaproteobacteria bacterium]
MRITLACLSTLLFAVPALAAALPAPDPGLQALQWRLVGPFRAGRVDAVAGIPGDGHVFYMGAAGGGIWKTTDAGHHWANVSDCCLDMGPVGALAVAPSDPDIIYAGTGEPFPRGDVLTGDGVWKSTDAGKSWRPMGLADTHIISNIVVDPKDAQHVYVGALGHLFGPNTERGVYESHDGGTHWQRVLFVDADTGVGDLAMDPNDPKTLYAALWQVSRSPWNLTSGGPGSGIWKTSDGGAHWSDITRNPGMTTGLLGRIGIALPRTAAGRVYAVVEATDGGLYRSDDGGAHWQLLYHKGDLNQRAWYFSRVTVDPKDADRLFVTEAPGYMISKDGGKTFKNQWMQGGDHHAMWIDPSDPKVMEIGSDGGAAISLDGGTSWSDIDNQPTAQFYRVNVDDEFPFHLYGAQQDCCTVGANSANGDWGLDEHDWRVVGQWESGYGVPVPGQPWIIYSSAGPTGMVEKLDERTGLKTFLGPWPDEATGRGAADLKYRFQWTAPLVASRYAPDTLYYGSQYVMKSVDGGVNWSEISPDLTRDDKSKQQPSGGPLHKDITSVEYYDTVFALAESPLRQGLLWAGTDDGKVWVTQDDGGHWQDVTPPDLPAWSTVNTIDASRFQPGTAYMAAHRYRLDDFAPYIYETHDYGVHWRKIVKGLPVDTSSFTVREDWLDPDLLFAGTLTAAWFSNDDGVHWQSLQQNLPHSAVTDLAVVPQQDSLAAATHGRAFWVLDQLQPLREISAKTRAADLWLYTPGTGYITPIQQDTSAGQYGMGVNPAEGASVFYSLKQPLVKGRRLSLSFSDLQGHEIVSYSAVTGEKNADAAAPTLTTHAGLNLFVWDLRSAAVGKGDEAIPGPQVLPGRYRVTLTDGNRRETREFEVKMDPRITTSMADLAARQTFLAQVQQQLGLLANAAERIDALRQEFKKHPADAARLAQLEDIAARLVVPTYDGYLESLAHPASLQARLGSIIWGVEGSYAKPSAADQLLFQSLKQQSDAELQALHAFDDVHPKGVTALRIGHPAVRITLQHRDDD